MSVSGGFAVSPQYEIVEEIGTTSRFVQVYYGETLLSDLTNGIITEGNWHKQGQAFPLPGQGAILQSASPDPDWPGPGDSPFESILQAGHSSAFYYLIKQVRCILKLPNAYRDTTSPANWTYGPFSGNSLNCFFARKPIVNSVLDSVGPNSNENPNIDNSFGFSLFSSMFDTGQMNAKVETLLQGNNNPGNAESPSLVTGVEWYVRRNESPAVGTDYQFAVGKSGWDPGTFTGNQDASDAALVLDIYSKKRNLVMRGTEFICIVASLPYMIKGPSATTYQGNTVGVGLYVDGYYSSDLGNLIPFFPVT